MGSVSRQRGETIISAHSTLRESFTASDYAENHQIPRNFAGVTLAAVLEDESKSAANDATVQTLFDIIRTEERPSNHQTDKKTWKSLKERFKLRRNNNSNAEANSFNSESARVDDGQRIQRSSRMRLFDALEAERERIRVSSIEPVRMSLMEVLDESTESPTGIQGPENQSDENEEGAEEKEEEEVEEKGGGGAAMAEMACCVCMVRHKGAAFIPCGHTFCRMCSREVWVQRGNCPLCNNSILEILDIF